MIRSAVSRKLRDTNFRLATIGVSVCLVLLMLMSRMNDQQAADPYARRASSFFTDNTGTRAIYLVLQRLLPAATQWRRPLMQLGDPNAPDAPTTLLIFAPYRPLTVSQAAALDTWMQQGGQVILVNHQDWPIRHAEQTVMTDETDAAEAQESIANHYLSRHGLRIRQRAVHVEQAPTERLSLDPYGVEWDQHSNGYQALVQAGDDVLVGSKRIGQGRLVVVPDATAFSNQRLRTSSNAVWLVTLCATWSNGRVLIDEFHQGFGAKRGLFTLLGLFFSTPWGWACAQVVLAGFLYAFGTRQRFGRVHEPLPQPSGSPLDLLNARSGLLAAARARQLAVEFMHQHLQYRLGKYVGYPINLADLPTRRRLLHRVPDLARHVDPYLSRVQHTLHGERISDRELVEIGRLAARINKELTT